MSLALDAAGLSQVVQAKEAQLTTALGSLAEAVTIQDGAGGLVYANEAALALLGFESEERAAVDDDLAIAERFDSFTADGAPLDMTQIPGRRILIGEDDPEPLEVRVIDKRTGEERWRLLKASGVRDPSGKLDLIVNVIADITAAKRSELAQRLLARAGEALASSLDYKGRCSRSPSSRCRSSQTGVRSACRTSAGCSRPSPSPTWTPTRSRSRAIRRRYPVSTPRSRAPRGSSAKASRSASTTSPTRCSRGSADEEHLKMLRGLGMRAALSSRDGGGRALGVLALVSAESGRSFSDDDLELAEELARRAGTAVEHSRLYTSARTSRARSRSA